MTTTITISPLPERVEDEAWRLRVELRDGDRVAARETVRVLQRLVAELAAELEK